MAETDAEDNHSGHEDAADEKDRGGLQQQQKIVRITSPSPPKP